MSDNRSAHRAWAELASRKPKAAAVLHTLVAHLGESNVVVVRHATLAKLLHCSIRTIKYAVAELIERHWIQRIYMGGTTYGYAINDRIVWDEPGKDRTNLSPFAANVLGDYDDQDDETLHGDQLLQMPSLQDEEGPST